MGNCVFDIGVTPHDDMHLSLQDGETTLMYASEAGHIECVKVLLDKGAEVNMQPNVSDVKYPESPVVNDTGNLFSACMPFYVMADEVHL